jgi:DNA-binding NarL/FixJ family response regulator
MISVLIIDDHQMIIDGIGTQLEGEKDIRWLGGVRHPDDLLRWLEKQQPDVLLMDINLPQVNGLDLCRQVKEKYPAINIVGLSTSNQASIIRKMMENGASGYLLKDASRHEVLAALQTAAKGKEYISHSVSEVLKNKMPDTRLPVLTRREKEVLELIAEGLTNAEIATKLFLTVTTVDSHRKNMLTKFSARNTAALVKLAVMNNLI